MSESTAAKATADLLQPATTHNFVNDVTRPHLHVCGPWPPCQFANSSCSLPPANRARLAHRTSALQVSHRMIIIIINTGTAPIQYQTSCHMRRRLPTMPTGGNDTWTAPLQGSVRYSSDPSQFSNFQWLIGHWMSARQCPSALFVSAIFRCTPAMEELIDDFFNPARTQTQLQPDGSLNLKDEATTAHCSLLFARAHASKQ